MPRRLDDIDRALLARLMVDGRASWAQLAGEVDLSAPSVTERLKKLEKGGVLCGFEGLVDPAAVGYGMLAFISVSASTAFDPPEFFERVTATPQIQECHLLTGEYDYLLKVLCRNSEDLYETLQLVQTWPGVGQTRSSLVLKTTKQTRVVPLDGGDPNVEG